jgi:hypothetical protein
MLLQVRCRRWARPRERIPLEEQEKLLAAATAAKERRKLKHKQKQVGQEVLVSVFLFFCK